ncbi:MULTISPECIES: branched-chain amino acid ABC transporter substrate-binding protein [Actinokineospora]|uniref:Branched chain amino acid ABC transporter substrate-binding protein n=1 Tax=Actinokineospora fastidiosa TaxID=1816 RepID=A0A918LE49_9PSEU|nr:MULTISPECIES: branched-chain amino acid ABC transporter substrate-binding protein [Actinokineospora]UVS80334.1 Leucine-, isoleucine-, valine-, threonine-, and alanine-binding protein precursor [Actinokineospora sp. UTMC 2448]GGS34545.1 branched chain amino acid ABC transporter substrate-binding protein [Actinokineospora fastidiosa]
MRNQTAKTAGLVAAGLLVLAACGTNKTEDPQAGGQQACDTSKGALTVGVIAPLSGDLSALGLGIKNSADLAVMEANEKCAVPGYRLVLDAQDDQKTPTVAGQAATKLATDPNIVGVVGTLNSSTSQTVQPILAGKKIVQVSPANTSTALTKGTDFLNNPKRPFDSYFRVCTMDENQGKMIGQYLSGDAGKKSIAIVTDGKTYGVGLAAEVKKAAEKNGAKIVAEEQVSDKDTDFAGVIAKIKPLNPDAVFYGGEYPQAGPLSKQMKDAGLDVPLMGGDGIFDDTFIELGGKEGDFATSVGAPPESLPSAKAFIDAYNARGFKDPYSAYGAFSYDSANVIITALAKTLSEGGGTWNEGLRDALIKNIGATQLAGANGQLGFDEFGDSTIKLLTVYKVTSGEWTSVKTGTVTE